MHLFSLELALNQAIFVCLVVTALISNGDEETAEGRLRSNALFALCDMNPGQAISTRTLCVEMGKMPSLMLKLSLKDPNDLVRNKMPHICQWQR